MTRRHNMFSDEERANNTNTRKKKTILTTDGFTNQNMSNITLLKNTHVRPENPIREVHESVLNYVRNGDNVIQPDSSTMSKIHAICACVSSV